ncbi:AgmX/PglI C-terminal domain-containing protein [Myxococcota bacterium]|nr:AgmX/PglI C-terminal domain-containing protein [Myxococcota bacterium]
MRRIIGASIITLSLGAAFAAFAQDAAQQAAAKQAEEQVYRAIGATASAIDACNDAYVAEYPASQGTAKIEVKVAKDGSVVGASVTTALEGARNLRPCLERVAKSWRFPAHGADQPQPMSMSVPIRKGAKFVLKRPGDKAEPAKAAAGGGAQEETIVDFMPTGWGDAK